MAGVKWTSMSIERESRLDTESVLIGKPDSESPERLTSTVVGQVCYDIYQG